MFVLNINCIIEYLAALLTLNNLKKLKKNHVSMKKENNGRKEINCSAVTQ